MRSPIVLELGSHSLKVHYVSRTSGIFRKSRFPWELGHEVYSFGRISSKTASQAVSTLQDLRQKGIRPESVLAIATGALRDAANRKEFLELLERKLGLAVRVISGREEASLLAQAYVGGCGKLPAMITDLGGGSLEFVYLGEDRTILRDSLPLGAIRLYHFGECQDGSFDREIVSNLIEDSFQDASLMMADEIHSTGGTAKAISKALGKATIERSELEEFEEHTYRRGPPAGLKADRARVFLPGLMVLRKLLDHARAERLTYLKVAVGRIFLQKYAQRLPARGSTGRGILLQDLRITQVYPHHSSAGLPVTKKDDRKEMRRSRKL